MELNWLEEAYGSGRAGLLVLYGRRRVGKTELLRVFCRGKRHVFFCGRPGSRPGASGRLFPTPVGTGLRTGRNGFSLSFLGGCLSFYGRAGPAGAAYCGAG
nr:hypothetical protein [Desulfofundulus thermobenzoicus]